LVYAFVASGGRHRRGALRRPGHGLVRARDLSGHVDEWAASGVTLAPAWRQRGVWLAGTGILLLGLVTLGRGVLPRACRWDIGMSNDAAALCSHCLLPVGLRATRQMLNGESCTFCCYGCSIAYQVKQGRGEESEAAWLLIRLGVGGFSR